MEVKRTRKKQIVIRCNNEEFNKINKKVMESGLTKQRYILEVLINGKIVKNDLEAIRELTFEINKIGTNINQIAKSCNIKNLVSKNDIDVLMKYLQLIIKLLRKFLKKETVI